MFEPDRHEALDGEPWHEGRARRGLEAIVRDAEANFDLGRLWPIHPLDQFAPHHTDDYRHKHLYLGASGVAWSLHSLRDRGFAALERDYADCFRVARRMLHEDYALWKLPVPAGYLAGDLGMLFASWRVDPNPETARELERMCAANVGHPANELMLGAPGMLLLATAMARATGDADWRALCRQLVRSILAEWRVPDGVGCPLWEQRLDGNGYLVGALHGAAGNLLALLRAVEFMDDAEARELPRRAAEVLVETAIVDGGRANWPQSVGVHRPGREAMLVQWCHGAPGVITCSSAIPADARAELEPLLVMGGELIWEAGPLAKGPGICHGTSGSGLALLRLFELSGDERWLDRARRFAMHALGQVERQRTRIGRGRYSLWTGDLGVAEYLACCLVTRASVPTIDDLF
jgi:hypothetical protein